MGGVACDVMGDAGAVRAKESWVKVARRMERLGTETAFSVLAKAKALEARGHEIIHLEIGEPDFDTPANVVEAGCRALRSGETHYTPTAGIPELRAAIADDVARSRGISVDPEQVVVTPGGKPIMFFAILALVDEGDEVLVPNPSFPIYESMVNFVGGRPAFVPLRQENGFRFDLDEFRAGLSGRTKMVILNSPANPTGGVLTPEDIAGLAGILRERPDVFVLSDEIYSRMLYDSQAAGQLELLHQRRHPARWPRSPCGPAGQRRPYALRVPRPPRPDRHRPERPSRRRLPHPPGRLLRLPAYRRHWPPRTRPGRPPPRRGGRRLPRRNGVRRLRRRPPAILLRQLA
jgi:DNA-binding transcriptional MocR family regulator